MRRTLSWVAACSLFVGCGIKHDFREPSLEDDLLALNHALDVIPPFDEEKTANGVMWSDSGPLHTLMRDKRAFRVNDLLTIRIAESTSATQAAGTELDKSSSASGGASTLFGLEDPNAGSGSFNLGSLLSTEFSSAFSGDGSTSRNNSMSARLTARVARVLPNGDLVVAGQKTVMINRERQVLTLVGSVRYLDVDAANQVPSDQVGELTVRLWGQGEIDDTVRQGWFMRTVNRFWPF